MRHRLLVVVVVGFWAVMMASLARRWLLEVKPQLVPGTYLAVLTPERRNYQTRMGIYVPHGPSLERVGYTETVFFYGPDEKYNITNTTRIEAPMTGLLSKLGNLRLDTTAVIGKNHALERLTVTLDSPAVKAECWGHVEGDDLVLRARIGGVESSERIPLPQGGLVASGLSPLYALPPLRVGQRWSVAVVDPLTLRPSTVEMEVVHRQPLDWAGHRWYTHVVDIRTDYLRARAWVSRHGEVLKERTLFGLTLIKEPLPGGTEEEGK